MLSAMLVARLKYPEPAAGHGRCGASSELQESFRVACAAMSDRSAPSRSARIASQLSILPVGFRRRPSSIWLYTTLWDLHPDDDGTGDPPRQLTDWMAADPEPDSRPGLREIVRIAKLRPSALVSVLFDARQRDPQHVRDFFWRSSMASNFSSCASTSDSRPELASIVSSGLAPPLARSQRPAFLPRVVVARSEDSVKSFSAQQGSHSPDSSHPSACSRSGAYTENRRRVALLGTSGSSRKNPVGLPFDGDLSASLRSLQNPQFLIPVYHHRVIQLLTL